MNFNSRGSHPLPFPDETASSRGIVALDDSYDLSRHRESASQSSDGADSSSRSADDAPAPRRILTNNMKRVQRRDGQLPSPPTPTPTAPPSTWFSRHRLYATTGFLLRFIVVSTLLMIIPSVITVILGETAEHIYIKYSTCPEYGIAGHILHGMLGMYVVLWACFMDEAEAQR